MLHRTVECDLDMQWIVIFLAACQKKALEIYQAFDNIRSVTNVLTLCYFCCTRLIDWAYINLELN